MEIKLNNQSDEAGRAALTTQAPAEPALKRFQEIEADPESDLKNETPLERLRFFLSIALMHCPQDWLDVEPFFDALAAPTPVEPAWKDHDIRELVNDVTQVAKTYGQTQQLRERIRGALDPAISALRRLAVEPENPANQAPHALEQRTGLYALGEAIDVQKTAPGYWLCIRFNTLGARNAAWHSIHSHPAGAQGGEDAPKNDFKDNGWSIDKSGSSQ